MGIKRNRTSSERKHTTKVKFSLISIFDSMELWIQLEVVLAKVLEIIMYM
jgi:hypothetical protein